MKTTRVAQELRRLMVEKGFTLTPFALRLGVTKSTVHRWLNGSRPEIHHRIAIETVLGLPAQLWLTSEELKAIKSAKSAA